MKRPAAWPRAILLDFYGTVVEEDDAVIADICGRIARASAVPATAADIGQHWSRVFSELCHESLGSAFRLQKQLEHISLEHTMQHFEAHVDAGALCQMMVDYWARPMIYPESRGVIASCGVPISLVSNIDNAELESALAHTEVRTNHIVTSEDCRSYKPRAKMFTKALELLGLQAPDVLHIGDSLGSDVGGARAAGILCSGSTARAGKSLPNARNPTM